MPDDGILEDTKRAPPEPADMNRMGLGEAVWEILPGPQTLQGKQHMEIFKKGGKKGNWHLCIENGIRFN